MSAVYGWYLDAEETYKLEQILSYINPTFRQRMLPLEWKPYFFGGQRGQLPGGWGFSRLGDDDGHGCVIGISVSGKSFQELLKLREDNRTILRFFKTMTERNPRFFGGYGI